MLWRMHWFIFSQLIIFQDKCISVSLWVSWSVFSAHIRFDHQMPHNWYLMPFITTLYSLRKTCFDTNVGYVCHMTACYIFVGMFVFTGSVSYVVWLSRYIHIYIYRERERESIYTVLYVYYLALSFMWSSFTIVFICTHDNDANIDITCLP